MCVYIFLSTICVGIFFFFNLKNEDWNNHTYTGEISEKSPGPLIGNAERTNERLTLHYYYDKDENDYDKNDGSLTDKLLQKNVLYHTLMPAQRKENQR